MKRSKSLQFLSRKDSIFSVLDHKSLKLSFQFCSVVAGRVRNIYFPFDIETDTAISVAREMVEELEMDDCDIAKIANMIDGEIASLVPSWSIFCSCASNRSSEMDFNVMECCRDRCKEKQGRFEEITFETKPL